MEQLAIGKLGFYDHFTHTKFEKVGNYCNVQVPRMCRSNGTCTII